MRPLFGAGWPGETWPLATMRESQWGGSMNDTVVQEEKTARGTTDSRRCGPRREARQVRNAEDRCRREAIREVGEDQSAVWTWYEGLERRLGGGRGEAAGNPAALSRTDRSDPPTGRAGRTPGLTSEGRPVQGMKRLSHSFGGDHRL
ncbi:unnamed protein product [Linum trigynum]|uniref:Uncharacterized protein n=1 Tax=Linum trigynum TaxID=586398 RepID=A0AAV2FA16_9ROSI